MKRTRLFRYTHVRVPLLFLLVISPVALFSTSAAAGDTTAAACTSQQLSREILDAGTIVSDQVARGFTEASPQYNAAITGFSVSFVGISNLWGFNKLTCSVTWEGLGVNYALQSANGSSYSLSIGENPKTNTITDITISPQLIANLYANRVHSETYSGYAVAANTEATTSVDYAESSWYVPTVYTQSGQTCGTLTAGTACNDLEWVGLQNSTYDGPDHLDAKGEVIQTGTEGAIQNCSTSCTINYYSWTAYLAGTAAGAIKNNTFTTTPCGNRFTTHAQDYMTGTVGSQLEINGTSGTKYYTILTDWTQTGVCESAVNFTSHSKTYGTEYYADFFLERPQEATHFFHLANFSALTFYSVTMGSSGATFGAYPDYDAPYGFASYMENNSVINTAIDAWTLNSGSTTYGYFDTTFSSSSGT
jgi:hypothetical protein